MNLIMESTIITSLAGRMFSSQQNAEKQFGSSTNTFPAGAAAEFGG